MLKKYAQHAKIGRINSYIVGCKYQNTVNVMLEAVSN